MKTFEEAFKVWEGRGTNSISENVKAGVMSGTEENYMETIKSLVVHITQNCTIFRGTGMLAMTVGDFNRMCGFVDSCIQIGVLIGIEMEKPDEREGGLQAMWEKDSGPDKTPKDTPDL